MAGRELSGTPRRNDQPEGSKPTRKSEQEDKRIRDEAQEETEDNAPLDPADEAFIEENK
jgi:hypothetical protein